MDLGSIWQFIPLRFTHPAYLWLLLLLPVVVLLTRRSLASLGPIRKSLAIGMRCLVLTLLIVALAGAEWVRVTDDQTAIFVLDRSASVPRAQKQAALDFVRSAAEAMRPGKDRVAVVAFDGYPMVEQLADGALHMERPGVGNRPDQTHLAGALRMAMALFPPETARRVVVLSDGNENIGQALAEAGAYTTAGVPIDVAPVRFEHRREMLIERLTAPTTARLEETINLGLIVRSQTPAKARILLYHNDELVDLDPASAQAGYPVSLDAGPNRFTIPVPLRDSGAQRFRAVLRADRTEDDSVLANNEGRAITIVGAAERVVILTEGDEARDGENAESARLLATALRQAGIECEVLTAGDATLDPGFLAGCSLVILSNIPAFALREEQQRALSSFVRDLGGGLIVIGGDRAFSVGGYHKTALEEVLPVETDRAKLKLLSLSMVIVIDRSGSMEGEKIDMARRAATTSVQLLNRLDRVGVIAFDSSPEWIAPLALCENKAKILQNLATIGAGGGTAMYPALEQALAALAPVSSNIKHVVVLTDGQSVMDDFAGQALRFRRAGITISAVAVGPDADRNLLNRLAQVTGGRMYATDSARPLPQIFARETVLASRSGMFEQPFTPQLRGIPGDSVLPGFEQSDFPPLAGYVVTAAKPLAQTPLVRRHEEGDDPILAYWQVGLGRTVAFTSGLWPRWGSQWVEWPGFSRIWAQCVRYASRGAASSEFQVVTHVEGDRARLVIEAQNLSASAMASVGFAGQIVGPSFEPQTLDIRQVGPGRFETQFAVPDPGVYIANLACRHGHGASARSGHLQAAVAIAYSPEFATTRHNETLLTELARRTDGRILSFDHPAAVYEPWSIRPIEARRPVWELLIRLMLIIFVFDVAVRRLAISPTEAIHRARTFLRELAGYPAPSGAAATVATLRDVRAQMQQTLDRITPPPGPVADTEPGALPPRERGSSDADMHETINGVEDRPVVAAPRKPTVETGQGEGEYLSRLRRAKQDARRRSQSDEPS